MMENIFNISPDATLLDIKDAITERIAKVKTLTSQFLEIVINNNNYETIDQESLETIISMINDFLDEIDLLYNRIN